jgi:flagellar assembly factor FliW
MPRPAIAGRFFALSAAGGKDNDGLSIFVMATLKFGYHDQLDDLQRFTLIDEDGMTFTIVRFDSEDISIPTDTIITFPAGIPGFESCHRFKLFHEEGRPTVFWLQSLDDAEVSFSLTDPALLKVSYEVSLEPAEQDALQVAPDDELQLAVLLSRATNVSIGNKAAVYAHTQSPIIINISKRLAIQKAIKEAGFTIHGC